RAARLRRGAVGRTAAVAVHVTRGRSQAAWLGGSPRTASGGGGSPAAGGGGRQRLKVAPREGPQQAARILALERGAPQAGLAGGRVLAVERHRTALVADDDAVALCRLGHHPHERREMQ